MKFSHLSVSRKAVIAVLSLASLGGAAAVGLAYAANAHGGVEARIQKNFPNTKISSVTCNTPFKGLCECVSMKIKS